MVILVFGVGCGHKMLFAAKNRGAFFVEILHLFPLYPLLFYDIMLMIELK